MFKVGQPSIRIVAAAYAASTLFSSAYAAMVYDDETPSNASQQMTAAPTNSVEVKNVITTTETVSTPPVVSESEGIEKTSEKSRKERNFHESMNNELVVQKLEDRRLKQEEKLTTEINKRFTVEPDEERAGSSAPVAREERARPIMETSTSYEMSKAPAAAPAPAQPIVQDRVAVYQSSTSMSPAPVVVNASEVTVKSERDFSRKGGVSITPRAGVSTLSNTYYEISPMFMVGAALGFDVTDNVAFELGYSYNEYGVRYGQTYLGLQPSNQLRFKNNTFDAGMKFYLSGLDARVRPFVGGGMAYSMGYINYNEQYQQAWQMMGQWYRGTDYRLSQFQAMAQGGLDFKVATNVTIGATYKFLKPLSSNETEEGLAYGYFYGQPVDLDKQAFRGTIRESNVHVFQLGASVTF